jgi:hypothetical protein
VQGLYKIYNNGILTKQGKNRIRQILAGKTTGFASSILVGIGETTPTVDDVSLDFSVEGANILNTMVDDVNNKVFFKTSLPVEKQYKIHELGCFAADGTTAKEYQQNSLLLSFGELTTWTDTSSTHTLSSVNTRLGSFSIKYTLLAAEVGRGSTPFQIGLEQLPPYAVFKFAYHSSNIADIKFRLKTTSVDYYESTIVPDVNNSYNISSVLKSDFDIVGSPSWSSITELEIQVTADATDGAIDLDCIRYDVNSSVNSALLSRALPSSPILKPAGSTMDIEYLIEGIV